LAIALLALPLVAQRIADDRAASRAGVGAAGASSAESQEEEEEGEGGGEEAAVVSAPSRHGTTQTELVGRERHLEVLHDVFGMVAAGATRSVFVYGRSGTGKSVLIHAFLEEIRARGQAVVLTGRCYEQESVPFKALDSLIDSLAEYLGMQPPETIRRALPEDSLPLVRLFPVIGQLPGTIDAGKPPIDNVDQQELRQRAMNALRMVLAWMTERSPVVLYIEDLQWGDVDSAIMLADLVRPPNSPPVMLLVSYRGEDVASSQCLKAMAKAFATGQHHPHRQELAVEALGEHDATRLALMLLEPGGALFTYSCSGGISADLFHKIVASAGIDAPCDGYISERMQGAPDHPMIGWSPCARGRPRRPRAHKAP
jgi:hypothetical protein